MTTIYNNNGFKIEFNGSATYFVSNAFDCVFHTNSKIKAINFVKKALKDEGKTY